MNGKASKERKKKKGKGQQGKRKERRKGLMEMVIVKVRIIAVVTMRNILFVNFTLEL